MTCPVLFDTTFLIDLQREVARRRPGRAFRFLEQNPDVPVQVSIVTRGEFAEGFTKDEADECEEILRPYPILPLSESIAWRYGQISKRLRPLG